ncbi:hypothetical protein [Methylocaldum szegediense]|uniref:hypothetical protein n=1 Tax=Methylocaldum szegediense TaxID=73780 RepID=UPI0012EB19A6|nr:hypothetical protein [Methylocaldum szegediense]
MAIYPSDRRTSIAKVLIAIRHIAICEKRWSAVYRYQIGGIEVPIGQEFSAMASSFRRFSHFCAQMHSPLFTPPQVPLMEPRPNMTPIAIKKTTAAITAKVIRNNVIVRLA